MIRDRRIGLLLALPVLAAIVFSWTRLVLELGDVPRDEDYVAARRVLLDEGFDGTKDALVLLPPWSLRPLQVMGDLDPISGDDIADKPLHRWARLWAVVEPDAEKEHDPLVARRGHPSWTKPVGRLVVERFDLPAPSVLYDLRAHLADAKVALVHDGAAEPCTRPVRGGVSCGKEGWQRVTREWLLVSENADDAVWSHPPPAGDRLEIEWTNVPLGHAVVVQAGFTRDGADKARAPVRLRVLVNGELAGTVTRKPAFAFHTDVVDTSRFAGSTGTLTFAVDTDDNSSAHFAWDATVVGKSGGAP